MKKTVIAMLLQFSLIPMMNQNLRAQEMEKKIIGTWKGSSEMTEQYCKDNKLEINERFLEQIPNLQIAFKKDGKLEVSQFQRTLTGSYKVIKSDAAKKQMTLKFLPGKNPGPPESEAIVKFIKVKMKPAVLIQPAGSETVVFVKVDDKEKDPGKKKQKSTAEKG